MSGIVMSTVYNASQNRKMRLFRRMTAVIFSPGLAMQSLAEKPRILAGLILIAFTQLGVYLLRLPLLEDYVRKSTAAGMEFMKSFGGMELSPQMIERSISNSFIQQLVMTPVGSLFAWFAGTLIMFAVFKIAGAQGTFKQYMSVTANTYIITAVFIIYTFGISFITGSLHIDLPVTSLAVLLNEGMKGSFIFGLFRGVEVFTIWYYAVISIGFSMISGFKQRTTTIIIGILFLVQLLIGGAAEVFMGTFMKGM